MTHHSRWHESNESDERRRDRRRSNEDWRFDRDRERSFESQGGRGRRDDDDAFDAPGGFAERDRWDLYEEWQQPRRMAGGYSESQRFGAQGGFPADRGARDFRERWSRPQEDWQRAQRYPGQESQRSGGVGYGGAGDWDTQRDVGQFYSQGGQRGARSRFGEQEQNRGFSGRGPKNYQRSDQRIQEDICDRLTSDPDVDASEIQVEVRNGEVTLEGTVEDRRMKRRAEDCIEDVSGVSQVHNRLRIGSQQEQGQKQGAPGQESSWARAGVEPQRSEQPRGEQQRADQPGSSQSRTGRIA
jgi:osmotically-inducible protein OsmY